MVSQDVLNHIRTCDVPMCLCKKFDVPNLYEKLRVELPIFMKNQHSVSHQNSVRALLGQQEYRKQRTVRKTIRKQLKGKVPGSGEAVIQQAHMASEAAKATWTPGHEAALDFEKDKAYLQNVEGLALNELMHQHRRLRPGYRRISSPPTAGEFLGAWVGFIEPCDDIQVQKALVRYKCTQADPSLAHFICTNNPFGPNMVCWFPAVGS